jgi:hypothetical protein
VNELGIAEPPRYGAVRNFAADRGQHEEFPWRNTLSPTSTMIQAFR